MPWDARRVYWINEGAQAFFFAMIFAVYMLFQVSLARLSALELVLVGTVLEATIFVLEVPTGIVADVYSRRLSVILGVFITGVSFLIPIGLPVFWGFALSSLVWGTGYTFTSGATSAWIVDEIGAPNAGEVFLRGSQVAQVAAAVGVLAGALLGGLDLRLPVLIGGVGFAGLGVLLSLKMPEVGFHPTVTTTRSMTPDMLGTFRQGIGLVRRRPLLVMIFVVTAIAGASSEGYDRLWTAHLVDGIGFPALDGVKPVHWIGGMSMASMLLSAVAAGVIRKRLNTADSGPVARALAGAYLVVAGGAVALALAGEIWLAVLAWLAVAIAREVAWPLQDTWINQQVDSRVRATVLSMSGQMDAAGQILGGPVLGAIGTFWSIRAALFASGLLLTPGIGVYARAWRAGGGNDVASAPPQDA